MRSESAWALAAGCACALISAVAAVATQPPAITPPPPLRQPYSIPPAAPSPPRPVPAPGPRIAAPKHMRAWSVRIHEAYPDEARQAGWEGVVGVRVTVSVLGRAEDCTVTRSSGHAILDDTACRSMVKYARFDPALDAKGQPTPGTFSTNITYRRN